MDEESRKKIVDFEKCKDCRYEELSESDDPCWDCLNEPVNENSHTPIKFEPKEETK